MGSIFTDLGGLVKVFFGLPCYNEQVSALTANSLNHTLLVLKAEHIESEWCYLSGILPDVRNVIFEVFLRSDCTHLFWIDTDIGFEPQSVLKLVTLDADIALGGYYKKIPNVRQSTVLKGSKWIDLDAHTDPMEIDSAGLGFVCIKRQVVCDIANRSIGFPDGTRLMVQTGLVDGVMCQTEDHAFFAKAKTLGYKAILDPTIKLKHIGPYIY